jgi:hypothetical protein
MPDFPDDVIRDLQEQQRNLDATKRDLDDAHYADALRQLEDIERRVTKALDKLTDPSGHYPITLAQADLQDPTLLHQLENALDDFASRTYIDGFPVADLKFSAEGLRALRELNVGRRMTPASPEALLEDKAYGRRAQAKAAKLPPFQYPNLEPDAPPPKKWPAVKQEILDFYRAYKTDSPVLPTHYRSVPEDLRAQYKLEDKMARELEFGGRLQMMGILTAIATIIWTTVYLFGERKDSTCARGTCPEPPLPDERREASTDLDNALRHLATATRETGLAQTTEASALEDPSPTPSARRLLFLSPSLAADHHASTAAHECQEANDDLEDAVRELTR